MLRKLALIALVPLLLSTGPAFAVTAKEKRETCKIGADSMHLTGAQRTSFLKKCMAKGDYEPPARREVMKKERAMKKSRAMAMKKPAPKKLEQKKQ